MLELRGDLWSFHDNDEWIVITTNGDVRRDGCAVMGRGIARQAARWFPKLPAYLGELLLREGNVVHVFNGLRLFTFPVKYHWDEPASLDLVQRSAKQLVEHVNNKKIDQVFMVRPGCGNGMLKWRVVKPIIKPLLDDRFHIVERRRR